MKTNQINSCCSFLEQNANKGFLYNLAFTFASFKNGFTKFIRHRNDPYMKSILKTSILILITAESACIITAETVTLLFYQYSLFLAIPLALVIGTFTLTLVKSARKIRNQQSKVQNYDCDNLECKECLPDSQSKFINLSEFRKPHKETS